MAPFPSSAIWSRRPTDGARPTAGSDNKNDENKLVPFKAIASVPSFELWLLLHFEDIQHPLHRDEVLARLKQHLHDYEKGADGVFAATRDRLETAVTAGCNLIQRAD